MTDYMGNNRQWQVKKQLEIIDNVEWQTVGDENLLEMADTGKWQNNGECQMMSGWNEAYSKPPVDGDFSS